MKARSAIAVTTSDNDAAKTETAAPTAVGD
jgi:hypothetical protein